MASGTKSKNFKKMKKIIAGATILLSTQIAFGQKAECPELQTKIENQKAEITELSKQNLYFKETLNLLKPLITAKSDNLQIDIIKAIGSKKDKTLKVYYIYKNLNPMPRKYFQPGQAYIVDPQGNQVNSFEVYASESQRRVDNIEHNLPIKGVLVFSLKDIENLNFPVLALCQLKFSNEDEKTFGPYSKLNFKNIPVTWN